MAPVTCIWTSAVFRFASEKVTSLPNLVVAYLRNSSLLFRKNVLFMVEPVLDIYCFASSLLVLVCNVTTATYVFPPLFLFLYLGLHLFPFPLLDMGTSGVLEFCLSSIAVGDKGFLH